MSDAWGGRGKGCNLIGLATPLLDGVFALQDAIFGGFTKLEVRAGFENTGMFLGDFFFFFFFIYQLQRDFWLLGQIMTKDMLWGRGRLGCLKIHGGKGMLQTGVGSSCTKQDLGDRPPAGLQAPCRGTSCLQQTVVFHWGCVNVLTGMF